MKVLFLFPHFLSPGGAANVVLKLARALQANGHQVEIFCAKASDEFLNKNADLKFIQSGIPASNSFLYWSLLPYWQLKLNRMLARYKDYVFFPHVMPSNWWAWLFKRKEKHVKVIWYCNEPSAFIHLKAWINAIPNPFMKLGAKLLNPFLKSLDTSLEKQSDVVICNSGFSKTMYETAYRKKTDIWIYPPVKVVKVDPEINKDNYILTVGRLSKFKNINLLIKAFHSISPELPNLRLIIVGDGEEKQNLVEQVNDLSIADKVLFAGITSDPDLVNFYRKAKMTVICSVNEPFGLVPIESMMYSTPVIAHNSGGPKETIIPGETGFHFNDETELKHYIKKIAEMDQQEYHRMQQSCLANVQRYDISEAVKKLESVLDKVSTMTRS